MQAKRIYQITGAQFDVATRHLELSPSENSIAFVETHAGRMLPYLLHTDYGPDLVVAYPERKLYGMGIEMMAGIGNSAN